MSKIRYARAIASCVALTGLALLLTLVLTHSGPAKPRPAPRPDGTVVTDWALRPGTYATAINIHNPGLGQTPVTLHKRAVIALGETATPSAPSAFQTYSLGAGYAVEVDCADILTLLGSQVSLSSTFIKGFVTVVATSQLDVVGVYTSEPPVVIGNSNYPSTIPGIGLEMLNITPRVELLGPATAVAAPGTIYEYSAKFLCGNSLPPG
ncbi:MAG: hypothetical protein ACLQVM_11480 [Terriglobia bacterium]